MLTETRRFLDSYRPSDAREAGFQRRMLELLDVATPFSRAHWLPGHFTASAFVLSPDRDQLLLIFHKKLGIWVQPGGHIEPDDSSLVQAARRELAEEVGLSLPVVDSEQTQLFDIDIHAIPARKAEPLHEHFDVRFRFVSSTLEFVASDEVADARWVKLSELPQLTQDESVLRVARKLG